LSNASATCSRQARRRGDGPSRDEGIKPAEAVELPFKPIAFVTVTVQGGGGTADASPGPRPRFFHGGSGGSDPTPVADTSGGGHPPAASPVPAGADPAHPARPQPQPQPAPPRPPTRAGKPGQHVCQLQVGHRGSAWRCDVCRADKAADDVTFVCLAHNYDECASCYATSQSTIDPSCYGHPHGLTSVTLKPDAPPKTCHVCKAAIAPGSDLWLCGKSDCDWRECRTCFGKTKSTPE